MIWQRISGGKNCHNTYMLLSVLAGVSAAAIAWVTNRLALKVFGPPVIICIVPIVEELAKTGLALLFKSSIIWTHSVFGLIEGLYDLFYTQKTGLAAGLTSITGHLLYGLITAWAFSRSGQVAVAVMSGYLAHMIWNLIVMKFLVRKKRSA